MGSIVFSAISANDSMLATVSEGITALYTLLPVPQLVAQWPVDGADLAFTPDGSLLVVSTEEGKTVAWDQEGARVRVFIVIDDGLILSELMISPDGKLLLATSRTPGSESTCYLDVWGVPED